MTVPPASAPSVAHPTAVRRTQIRHALVVALFAIVPMLPILRAPFMYDDTTIVRDNAWLRGWGALWRVWGEPYWPTTGPDALGLYRPMHVALLALTWNVTHGSALAFHLYAIALSAGASLAVWWLLRRATSATAALIGALWFATHPLHVEAVASAANSSEMLVVLATIAMLALRPRDYADVEESWRRAGLFGVLAGAALLSKESGLLMVPLALATAWGWRVASETKSTWRATVRGARRGLVVAGVTIVAALIARRLVLGAAISRTSIAAQGVDIAAWSRIRTMLSLWPRIGASILLPNRLAPYYGPSIVPTNGVGIAIASVLVALAVAALAIVLAVRGDRRPLVALAWIVLTYLPASNLLVPTGQLVSDRTLFGATVGAACALAWIVDVVPRPARRASHLVAALLIAHASIVTADYAVVWTSHRALWTRLIETQPAEHLGYKLLGMDARARGERELAVTLLARAQSMAPSDRQIRFEYGQALYEAQRYAAAAAELGALLPDSDVRDEPGFVALYLDAVGRSRGAQAVIDAARPLQQSRSAATAALYAGTAFEQLGRLASADSAYAAGLAASPRDSSLLARLRHR